jgi:hypothetical protein
MKILLVGALLCALADPTHEQSSTRNNAANRAAAAPPSEAEQMAQVPGGPATPKSEWRTGDSRGKPKVKRPKAKKKQRAQPQQETAR